MRRGKGQITARAFICDGMLQALFPEKNRGTEGPIPLQE